MIFVLLAILASTAFGAGLKVSENRGMNRLWVAFFNYITAAIITFAWWAVMDGFLMSWATFLAGLFAGVTWVGGLIMIMIGIKEVGVALTSAFARLAFIAVVGACVFFWKVEINNFQIAGLCLAGAAMILVSSQAATRGGRITLWGVFLLVILFVSQAFAMLSLAIFKFECPQNELTAFNFMLFASATVLCGVCMLLRTHVPGRGTRSSILIQGNELRACPREATFGIVLGIPNLFSAVFPILALATISETIVFPATSAGSVLLLTLLGAVLWKEKLGRNGFIGIALAILALALLNFKT